MVSERKDNTIAPHITPPHQASYKNEHNLQNFAFLFDSGSIILVGFDQRRTFAKCRMVEPAYQPLALDF